MRFFIDEKLIFILCSISLVAVGILLLEVLISLLRKVSYVSNMIWNRDRFVVWLLSIWLFGIFPLWLALLLWSITFFLLKYIVLKKDLVYGYHLVSNQSKIDVVCTSFAECMKTLVSKTRNNINISKNDTKIDFSFWEYTNTLIVVPVYYLFGIVNLHPEKQVSYVIGCYMVAIATFVLIARLVYAILNQKGNIAEKGLYSYLFITVLGIIYFVLLTLLLKNLGYITL